MIYLCFFLIGFGFTVAGSVTMILYLNLIPAGLTWMEYFKFILSRSECYLVLIGIIIISVTIPKLAHIVK